MSSMAKTFREWNPEQAVMFPPTALDLVERDDLVNFVRNLVLEQLDLSEITRQYQEERGYKEHAKLEQQALVEHIISTHHVFTRYELARLARLIEKVVSVHGMRHGELFQVQEIFLRLYDDLAPHLVKEENVLFPYIIEMAKALRSGSHCESPCFGTVQNPARMMSVEHEAAGELLSLLRKVTSNYSVPADACISYQTLYRALADFESDLHQHIHLENNILFPRAIQMEARLHPGRPDDTRAS